MVVVGGKDIYTAAVAGQPTRSSTENYSWVGGGGMPCAATAGALVEVRLGGDAVGGVDGTVGTMMPEPAQCWHRPVPMRRSAAMTTCPASSSSTSQPGQPLTRWPKAPGRARPSDDDAGPPPVCRCAAAAAS